MSTADHATCCCADTLAEVARLTAERDRARARARALAIRLEAEAAQPYLPAQMPEAVPREGQEGAENAPSRAADGLAGSDRHSGTPAAGEARKSAESDADDDAEWDAREAIERARGGR